MTRNEWIESLVPSVAAGMAANPECDLNNRELAAAVFNLCEELWIEGRKLGFYEPRFQSREIPEREPERQAERVGNA